MQTLAAPAFPRCHSPGSHCSLTSSRLSRSAAPTRAPGPEGFSPGHTARAGRLDIHLYLLDSMHYFLYILECLKCFRITNCFNISKEEPNPPCLVGQRSHQRDAGRCPPVLQPQSWLTISPGGPRADWWQKDQLRVLGVLLFQTSSA